MRLSLDDIQLFTDLRLDDMQRLALSQPHRQFLDIRWKLKDLRSTVQYVVTLRHDTEAKIGAVARPGTARHDGAPVRHLL